MTDVLIIGDTFRSPELRNEIPLAVPDPFVYLERDGEQSCLRRVDGGRRAFAASASISRFTRSRRSASTSSTRQGLDYAQIRLEWIARACVHAGSDERRRCRTRSRPDILDRIRQEGIELTVDQPTLRRSAAA